VESPTVTIEPRKKRRRNGRRQRGGARRWLRRLALGLMALLALPLLLSLLYLISPVRPVSTLMIKDLASFRGYERQWTPLEEIGPRLVNSVLMSEDGQFCSHHGIDLGEFRAVLQDFLAGEATRGGSTITMQTAKNLYLWHGRSYVRKALELPYAVYLDLVMPKRRIMEIYLNIAEWGPGIYGAEAASRHHFGKSSRELTARQAALLAVTLPNPLARTPGKPTNSLNRLAATIERRAGHSGGYNGWLK
jgi:monofunctional biosynthetic peptidoglycan transglycosylase